MKRSVVLAGVLFMVFVAISHPWAKSTEFRSDAGRFSVIVPEPIKQTTVTTKSILGKMVVPFFRTRKDNILYSITYFDFPSYLDYARLILPAYDPEKRLEEYCQRLEKKLHAKVISQGKITLDNNPGREVVLESAEKLGRGAVLKAHVFLVGNRLYHMMVVAPRGKLDAPEVTSFFDSFRVRTK